MTRGIYRIAAALALELAPAALLNFAVAFAVASVLRQAGFGEVAAPASVASGIVAFLAGWLFLRRVGFRHSDFALPEFDQSLVATEVEEQSESAPDSFADEPIAADELLLDDIVGSIGADSRVIRLFDPRSLPTAGELQARIDQHLETAPPRQQVPDATQELHEALAALRQSLR